LPAYVWAGRRADMNHDDTHENNGIIDERATSILQRGFSTLIDLAAGMSFRPLVSEKYQLPLAMVVYGVAPDPAKVQADLMQLAETDPVAGLEYALVMLELYASNVEEITEFIPSDDKFLGLAFSTKHINGWASFVGETDFTSLKKSINEKWNFNFIGGLDGVLSLYVLLK